MNTIYRAGWVLTVLLCTAGWISAQKSSVNEELVKADRQFALYAYNLAMQTYQGVLRDDPNNAHALARIGDCYYQLDNPDKSLEWYQRAIRQSNVESDVHLRYGKALMQTGDYEDARDQFRAYAEVDQTIGDHYAQLCDYAVDNSKKESAWLVQNEALNTEYADYSPAFLGSRIVYNSARSDMAPKSKSGDLSGSSLNYLLVTQRNPESGFLQKPQLLRSELQNTRNEGPVSFSADGRRVAFCRNNFINGTRQIAETGINMSMYTADVDENGKWSNIKAFPFNGSDYATGFPSLSPDGNTLIFASTQPGGFGGWDIYVSNFRDGAWTTPRNLGSPLNTPGNEVTPFFDGESLYFSSDWHFGLGGLDVFRAELGPERVSNVYHLGPGINSARDDYGFVYDKNANIGYVTSNRSGGRGAEDIWKATKKWNDEVTAVGQQGITGSKGTTAPSTYDTGSQPNTQGLHLLITDERGNEIPGAEVDLTDCYGDKGYTASDGTFNFVELNNTIDCQAVIKKSGYRDATIVLHKFGKQNVRISMTPESRESYTGRVYDANSKAPLRGVAVQVQFEDGTKNVETQTADDGSYSLNLDPGSTYLVNYGKYGYIDQISKTYFASGMNNIPSIMMEKAAVNQPDYVDQNGKQLAPLMHDATDTKNVTILKKKQVVEEPKVVEQAPLSGYAIQLAAMPEQPGDNVLRNYEPLTKDGNLYVKSEKNLNKIRLGVYKTRPEAEAVLKNVTANRPTKDAFIVPEYGADNDLVVGGTPSAPKPVEHSTEGLAVKGLSRPAVVYALQLATYTADKTIAISDYNALRGMGNLYSNTNNGYTQVRLGIWQTHDEAIKARQDAIDRGFPKATIVTEEGNDPNIQDFIMDNNSADQKKAKIAGNAAAPKPQVYSTETPVSNPATPYYVKLAALSNPDRFDGSSLSDLGNIQKRPAENAPGLTVILLGGYSSNEAADAVLKKVRARGYDDAYVMKEEKGKLIRK